MYRCENIREPLKEKVEDATLYRTVRINLSKSKEKYVLTDLLKSPEAVQSGILENDKIVAIDGQHISDFSAENINDILHEKLNEDQLTIVISRSKSKIGKSEMKPEVLESLDEMLELDSAIESAGDLLDVHRVKIDLNNSSYGFFLGEDHHTVTDIHPDKAAAKSGIQEGDRIVEIKGVNVENER